MHQAPPRQHVLPTIFACGHYHMLNTWFHEPASPEIFSPVLHLVFSTSPVAVNIYKVLRLDSSVGCYFHRFLVKLDASQKTNQKNTKKAETTFMNGSTDLLARKKVAIVGSGSAGIAALWALNKTYHDVYLYEAADRLGGHTNTVQWKNGKYTTAVDTGFIVVNTATYRKPISASPTTRVLLIRCQPTSSTF